MESSKFIGILLYAVDAMEEKVGTWEIPPEIPIRFWTPSDPGCDGKALMHRDASPKNYHHEFQFRAPAAGAGTLTFRALVKQGDTNGGAFYWPLASAMANPRDDLQLTEGVTPSPNAPGWFQATSPADSCDTVCAAAGAGRTCDGAKLATEGVHAESLNDAISSEFSCSLPIISSCDAGAPSFTTSGVRRSSSFLSLSLARAHSLLLALFLRENILSLSQSLPAERTLLLPRRSHRTVRSGGASRSEVQRRRTNTAHTALPLHRW